MRVPRIRTRRVFAMGAAVLTVLGFASCASVRSAPAALRIVSWNMEHLAEVDNSGCRPRTEAEYQQLRSYAASLKADVIAFQEVESKAAAERVFDPRQYQILIETRPGTPNSRPPCNGAPEYRLNRQATGFAIRRELAIERHSDLTDLQIGDANLRSGVDVTLTPLDGMPIRLMSVHLKSGCAAGSEGAACDTLTMQAKVLESWIEARAADDRPFAILGDFNRRLANPDDAVWSALDGTGPANMHLASGTTTPRCDPRYTAYIDYIITDPRLAQRTIGFDEVTFPAERLSDHCAIRVSITGSGR